MRLIAFFILAIVLSGGAVHAQQDTSLKGRAVRSYYGHRSAADSAALQEYLGQQYKGDSIAMFYLKPDPARADQFLNDIWKNNLAHYAALNYLPLKPKGVLNAGQVRASHGQWIIGVIALLFVYTALLNLFLGKDIRSVLQSFYNRHALSQTDKEGGLINSWAFIGLFVLFCLSAGMVLYQLTVYKSVYYGVSGFQLFISFSVVISLLFVLKFFVLKFLGFVFDINVIVSEYIGVLNLTYFNIAFVLLFVAMCFSLISERFIPLLLNLTLVAIVAIFIWQYLRNSVNIISNFRFHKFYLFIYLCALEICPVLILIKALNI